jgi:hypothetical protein
VRIDPCILPMLVVLNTEFVERKRRQITEQHEAALQDLARFAPKHRMRTAEGQEAIEECVAALACILGDGEVINGWLVPIAMRTGEVNDVDVFAVLA